MLGEAWVLEKDSDKGRKFMMAILPLNADEKQGFQVIVAKLRRPVADITRAAK